MKKQLLRIFVCNFVLLISAGAAFAQNVYVWTGKINTVWTNQNNWLYNGAVPANYPGATTPNSDVVRVGVDTAYTAASRYPIIAAGTTINIASLTFGNNRAGFNTAQNVGGGVNFFTVNGTLNVSGAIKQLHSATGGATGSGGTEATACANCFVYSIITTVQGTGLITCDSFQVGDNTVPGNKYVNDVTLFKFGGNAVSTLQVVVNGDFVVNSASANDGDVVTKNSRALVSLQAGTLTINGVLKLTNYNPFSYVVSQYQSITSFSLDLQAANANSPVLNLANANPISVSTAQYTSNTIDFYNYSADPYLGTGTTTVNYSGNNDQTVYNYKAGVYPEAAIDNFGKASGEFYQNLGFSGSGIKKLNAGTFKVPGNFTVGPGTEIVDVASNNPTITIGGNFINTGGTFNNGTNPIVISGGFSNTGTNNFGTPLITFNSTGAATFSATSPQLFNNVLFTGGGTKTMTGGMFNIATTGQLTISANTTLAANGYLTLKSNASSSATIPVIPSGSSITGDVNVERWINAVRGYRLISSPVYTLSGANKVWSLNYIKNSAVLTGFGGGMDKYGNPTIYLYREDVPVSNTTFISGNYRGINDITTPPTYTIDLDGPGFQIPAGAGILFFFRGNRADGTIAQETSSSWPATTATLTATGTLNQGQVIFKDWYNSSTNLGNTNSDPAARGNHLIGNPYASSIDWETFNTTTPNSGIYGSNLLNTVYEYNPQTKNYDTYMKGGGYTNKGSRTIVSGQGFFVQVASGASSGQLIMNEDAKSNLQNSGLSLFMGTPADQNANNQYLRLQMAKDSVNTDDIMVRFNSNAKTDFVQNEDALYKFGQGLVGISSISSDNRTLAINQLPLPKQTADVIPLKISATTDGTYSLNLTQIKSIPQLYAVWLIDAYKKDSVNLRQTASYSFNIVKSDTSSYGSKRFSLVIRQDAAFAYKLLDFNATKEATGKTQVEVVWKAQNEENYTNFTVERSTDDGKTFDVIGSLQGSGQGTYSLLDKSPIIGKNVYRLKQEDLNNTITYSNLITVEYSNLSNTIVKNVVCVYPNPAKSVINLSIAKNANNNAFNIRILNSSGLVVKEVTSSQTEWQGNVSNLLTGTYVIQVVNSKDKSIVGKTKFVKL